jgi:hypothetical protein
MAEALLERRQEFAVTGRCHDIGRRTTMPSSNAKFKMAISAMQARLNQ